MRKILFAMLGAGALLATTLTVPAQAAPTSWTDAGATIGVSCQTAIGAFVDDPTKRVNVLYPLQIMIGISVGANDAPCGMTNLILDANLYLLPVRGPRTLVGTATAHGTCSSCEFEQTFGGATVPPGVYQVTGAVRQGSLNSTPLVTIVGRKFLYTGLDISASPI